MVIILLYFFAHEVYIKNILPKIQPKCSALNTSVKCSARFPRLLLTGCKGTKGGWDESEKLQ